MDSGWKGKEGKGKIASAPASGSNKHIRSYDFMETYFFTASKEQDCISDFHFLKISGIDFKGRLKEIRNMGLQRLRVIELFATRGKVRLAHRNRKARTV